METITDQPTVGREILKPPEPTVTTSLARSGELNCNWPDIRNDKPVGVRLVDSQIEKYERVIFSVKSDEISHWSSFILDAEPSSANANTQRAGFFQVMPCSCPTAPGSSLCRNTTTSRSHRGCKRDAEKAVENRVVTNTRSFLQASPLTQPCNLLQR